jgi:hypothetical protein
MKAKMLLSIRILFVVFCLLFVILFYFSFGYNEQFYTLDVEYTQPDFFKYIISRIF